MQAEVDSLIREIDHPELRRVMGYVFAAGRIGGSDVVVGRCGVGKVNAAVCAQTMLMAFHPEVIINTGVAGSLNPGLDILDVAVATDAVQHDYNTVGLGEPAGALSINGKLVVNLPCDERWRARLLEAAECAGVRATPCRIASGDQFITRGEDKRHIVETFGAWACEMEGAAIAQVCYLAGVPCAILRAISDSTDDNHQMEFEAFLHRAVENSFHILLEVLK